MKHTSIFAAVSIALFGAVTVGTGCGSSTSTGATGGKSTTSTTGTMSTTTTTTTTTSTGGSTTGTGGMTTSSTGTGTTNPPPPALGMQLDRMGRPAVNTVLNHGFDGSAAAGPAKDAYNMDSDPTKWAANYAAQIAANLAIVDAVDGTCGNQLGYKMPASATSYALLSGALADDQLYLNTKGTTMTQYLAVEANALMVVPNMDQGGRGLAYPVVDTTLSVLAIGALTGVTNGILANEKAFTMTFPYEAAPN